VVKDLQKIKALSMAFIVLILASTSVCGTLAQESENMQTFFELRRPGIKIQVNATKNASPGKNITVILQIEGKEEEVYFEYLNLSIYGFINGQNKTALDILSLKELSVIFNETKQFPLNVTIPSNVWDATYGELSFKYYLAGEPFSVPLLGFTMTYIRNIYLEDLESQFQSLSENFTKLQQNYTWLEGNYTELKEKYDKLSGSVVELENTRSAMVIFAITTFFFVATTAYLFLRKPKQSW